MSHPNVIRFSSLRVRFAGSVLVALAMALGLMYILDRGLFHLFDRHLPWPGLFAGSIALAALWFAVERFVLRQVASLASFARQLAAGDLSARTGMGKDRTEMGDLARTLDSMAGDLQQQVSAREKAEKSLLSRALQQTVVSALGQFALVNKDFQALLTQAGAMVSQTLEIEFCSILELNPELRTLRLESGVGWMEGAVGTVTVSAEAGTQGAFVLSAGDPVCVEEFGKEERFTPAPYLLEHGVASGMEIVIAGQGRSFGTLGAYTSHNRVFSEDEVHFLMGVATVLGMAVVRRQTERELEKLAAFAQLNPNPAMELDAGGNLDYFNDAALKLAVGMNKEHPRALLPENVGAIVADCLESQSSVKDLTLNLDQRVLCWSFHPVAGSLHVHAYVEDITERLNLEAQLRQSQKMESVGQLAAGVAHDFNNMLTIIQGHAGMMLARAKLPGQQHDSLQAILFAAERAGSLTRQLLVFSRKSVLQPRNLDLREVVTNLNKMLQRLLGETISLEFKPPTELPLVRGDAGMVEQALMNLAINARDAMPGGGQLILGTETVTVDEEYVHSHPEARVGEFVCLRVRDTGCGMDPETLSRIFEPFFTTKEPGKGTGLGLATVYGIVRQHEGWIEVASQPGLGTTFRVFLPVAAGADVAAAAAPASPSGRSPGGDETILLVEDEPVLREMAQALLENSGYTVLAASSGREALLQWEKVQGEIDLLLSDVVMPEGISGLELAQKLRALKPSLKVVFVSGYPMDELDAPILKKTEATLLQKPYNHALLALTIREALDEMESAEDEEAEAAHAVEVGVAG